MTAVLAQPRFADTVQAQATRCPTCGGSESRAFYRLEGVPVHQVRLVRSRAAALDCPRGRIELRLCRGCGFVWNSAFEPALVNYEDDYESTQTVSPVFRDFHADLARQLVERFGLHGRHVLEIGCGQGEFLGLLLEHGVGRATGFDPVVRDPAAVPAGVELVKEWYTEAHGGIGAEFILSKMVMEHIPDPGRLFAMQRRALGAQGHVVVFHMMPQVQRILELRAFWDIYYEHCTYFSLGSLARAGRAAGFDVVDVWPAYDDQYACIAMRPGTGAGAPLPREERVGEVEEQVDAFAAEVEAIKTAWRDWLIEEDAAGRRIAVWGGGSKGVAFLTSLQVGTVVDTVVDLNPKRHGTFVAGTGHRIVHPDALPAAPPDIVVVMSPIYRAEIAGLLASRGLYPQLVSVEELPPETAVARGLARARG